MAGNLPNSDRVMLVRGFLKVLEIEFENMVKDFGEILSNFNIAHWKILMSVWEHSGNITQTEAKKIISTLPKFQSDKTQRDLIKELSSAGMIIKTLDPKDERRVILSIANDALPKIERYIKGVERAILDYSNKLVN